MVTSRRALPTVPVDVFLLYRNAADWPNAQQELKSCHGSLEEALGDLPCWLPRDAVPSEDGTEYIVAEGQYTIKVAKIQAPAENFYLHRPADAYLQLDGGDIMPMWRDEHGDYTNTPTPGFAAIAAPYHLEEVGEHDGLPVYSMKPLESIGK